MISIKEAQHLSLTTIKCTNTCINLPLYEALGHHLSEDIYSGMDMPPFRQSAMDGYALNTHHNSEYKLIGEVKAGDDLNPSLLPGEAVRIFTGAAVPDAANAVIMQEKVTYNDGIITIQGTVDDGVNIRLRGEQIKKGDSALAEGSMLTASAIGFLASLGITSAKVYKKPSVGIVITGNELCRTGTPLVHGQVYESNSIMLQSVLKHNGFENSTVYTVKDDYTSTKEVLKNALENNDWLLISGGISVGDYDFVGKALNKIGIEQIFHKVKQKPGKPLYFGKLKNQYVFALPGNPAAALSCFYVYVLPALKKYIGDSNYNLQWQSGKATNSFIKKGDRPQFLKALKQHNGIEILDGQASSMLHTFAIADALVFMDENENSIEKGQTVKYVNLRN